ALAWARANGEVELELTIGATLLRALPPPLYAERVVLADTIVERLLHPVPDALAARAWIEISCAWANTQRARSLQAARCALDLARKLDPSQQNPFTLYHALCLTAGSSGRIGKPELAVAPLAEMQQLEDPNWPAQRLIWGAQAEQFVAHARGDGAGVVRASRR